MTKQDWQRWQFHWNNALAACKSHGGSAEPLATGPPATSKEIEAIEKEVGSKLPKSLRLIITSYSGEVQVSWQLPDEAQRPETFREIFSGGISWSLKRIKEAENERRGWQKNVFADPKDEYDAVWHNKLGFMQVPNGDVIAFDLKGGDDPPVVYLSHEDGECHGYRLGDNFIDFVDRWTRIGCPGPEDWQMSPFLASPQSGFGTDSTNASEWRKWFGMDAQQD
ncbi:MAG: SMI1/KNR4 family protein [Planctomycetaceae bacterium]|nr:SMI1/KNR4 family protein [Planctomycetaceae bacterium]